MNSLNDFYVYWLIDPVSEIPFYVGKGRGNRALDHFKLKAGDTNIFKKRKISKFMRDGYSPKDMIKYVVTNLTNSEAIEFEELTIQTLGRRDNKTGILTNLTDGELGYNRTKESWKKCGRDVSGCNNPMYGKSHSADTLNILSIKAKERMCDLEYKANLSKRISDTINSSQYKQKISKIRSGKNPKSVTQIEAQISKYKLVIDRYLTKPILPMPCDSVCPKSGRFISYKRKFATTFSEEFNMCPNNITNFLCGKYKTYNSIFLQKYNIDLCNI